MPKLFEIFGYAIYFWANEGNEPIHVHISKGKASPNSTKVWILENNEILLDNNKSAIPQKELRKILKIVELHSEEICNNWCELFGREPKFYI